MGRLNISSSTLTSQNQGGGNSKAGLPSTIGLGPFSWRITRRRTNYCCLTGEIDATGGNDDDITYTGFTGEDVYTLLSGSIIVGGSFTAFNGKPRNGFIKLNDDGSPDTVFNTNLGTGFTRTGEYPVSIRSIIKDQSGNYIIGGFFDKFQDQSANHIIKLNSSGNIDPDFSNNVFGNGFNGFTINGSFAPNVNSIIEDQSGNYIIGGFFDKFRDQSVNCIIKLDSSGNIDTDFSNNVFGNGENGFTFNGDVGIVISIIEDAAGNYIIGGFFDKFRDQSANNIIKLDSSGNIDADFSNNVFGDGENGFTRTSDPEGEGGGNNVPVLSIIEDQSGNYIIGGRFDKFRGQSANSIIKLDSSGNIDPDFSNNVFGGGENGFTRLGNNFGTSVRSIIEDQSGNYIIGGDFNKFRDQSANCIIKLDSSGNIDPDFSNNVFGNGENGFTNDSINSGNVKSIIEDQSGNYIIGGNFDKFRGQSANSIIKLDKDGKRVASPDWKVI
jgi:hypothetical protein